MSKPTQCINCFATLPKEHKWDKPIKMKFYLLDTTTRNTLEYTCTLEGKDSARDVCKACALKAFREGSLESVK